MPGTPWTTTRSSLRPAAKRRHIRAVAPATPAAPAPPLRPLPLDQLDHERLLPVVWPQLRPPQRHVQFGIAQDALARQRRAADRRPPRPTAACRPGRRRSTNASGACLRRSASDGLQPVQVSVNIAQDRDAHRLKRQRPLPALHRQQPQLHVQPACIPVQRPVRSDYPVTWDHQRHRVGAERGRQPPGRCPPRLRRSGRQSTGTRASPRNRFASPQTKRRARTMCFPARSTGKVNVRNFPTGMPGPAGALRPAAGSSSASGPRFGVVLAEGQARVVFVGRGETGRAAPAPRRRGRPAPAFDLKTSAASSSATGYPQRNQRHPCRNERHHPRGPHPRQRAELFGAISPRPNSTIPTGRNPLNARIRPVRLGPSGGFLPIRTPASRPSPSGR